MDAYHQVLLKLYEETGGRESKAIDFVALHKKLGFYNNYRDIFERLNREGWITEAPASDYVFITHWGVMEAKKSKKKTPEGNQELNKSLNRTLTCAKEFVLAVEEFAKNAKAESFSEVQQKLDELNTLTNQLKTNL